MRVRSLAETTVGAPVRIVGVTLDADAGAWLAAVGLHVGEQLVILRRAPFGGPLHVKTRAGGEFAVARELAVAIDVEAEEP
jgi:ferrous iron transport protein A